MQRFLDDHPGVLVWLLVALVVSAAAGVLLARRPGVRALPSGLLLAAFLLPLALTLTPSRRDVTGLRECTTVLRPYGWWGAGGEELANAVMLAPIGLLATVLLGRRALPVLLAAACLPLVVEATQLLAPALGRSCDVLDVLLNTTGLLAGTFVGLVLRLVSRRAAAGPASSPARPDRSGARSR